MYIVIKPRYVALRYIALLKAIVNVSHLYT